MSDEVMVEAETDHRAWLRDEYVPPVPDDLHEDMATFRATADREADRLAKHLS
jgi:hypothetical protein